MLRARNDDEVGTMCVFTNSSRSFSIIDFLKVWQHCFLAQLIFYMKIQWGSSMLRVYKNEHTHIDTTKQPTRQFGLNWCSLSLSQKGFVEITTIIPWHLFYLLILPHHHDDDHDQHQPPYLTLFVVTWAVLDYHHQRCRRCCWRRRFCR